MDDFLLSYVGNDPGSTLKDMKSILTPEKISHFCQHADTYFVKCAAQQPVD